MIIKSLTRTSGGAGGLMMYMFQEQKIQNQLQYQTREEMLTNMSISHLLKGSTVNEWVEEFEKNQENRKYTRKGMVIMYHDIVSFSKEDTPYLNEEKLRDIARQYIQLRSPDAPAVATFHNDVEHLHIHFALAGSKYMTGMANRVSKHEFASIKGQMQDYQIATYPELIHSLVEHGKGREYITEDEFQVGKRKPSKREQVEQKLNQIFSQVASTEELYQLLEQEDIPHYERGNKVYGVTFEGRNYRFSTLGFSEKMEQLEAEDFHVEQLGLLRSGRNYSEREETNSRLDYLNSLAHDDEDIPLDIEEGADVEDGEIEGDMDYDEAEI